jgi:hypothetical protein
MTSLWSMHLSFFDENKYWTTAVWFYRICLKILHEAIRDQPDLGMILYSYIVDMETSLYYEDFCLLQYNMMQANESQIMF